MSVDINWETLTSGPDGEALAEKIRDFVHERFQHIPFPKLIRSVKVQGFEFGSVVPEIVLKDICEPLADFYEGDDDDDEDSEEGPAGEAGSAQPQRPAERLEAARERMKNGGHGHGHRQSDLSGLDQASASQLSRGTTPGFLHGATNLNYFNLPLGNNFSGSSTPLAAVAGARFPQTANATPSTSRRPSQHRVDSTSDISPPSPTTPPLSRPISRDALPRHTSTLQPPSSPTLSSETPPIDADRSPEDLQIVFHASYNGDVRLALTAEVFLDYPMPSFVGIPLKLTITGLSFDGVGILAYIKRKAHLCFLAPEDAEALVSPEVNLDSPGAEDMPEVPHHGGGDGAKDQQTPRRIGGLIEDIRIESEMGETGEGKQVLKNVGKIEKFILEQVQRIFEDEFVYPSFWTFLV